MRITAGDIDAYMLVGTVGIVFDPAITPYLLMPARSVRDTDGPCWLWLVTRDDASNLPSEAVMGSFDEVERTCDAANAVMGCTREEVNRIILASLGSGTA